MANEWVKNQTDASDPKILRLSRLTGHRADAVYRAIVGRWWFWVDQNCKGPETGLTLEGVDEVLCLPGKRGKMSLPEAMMDPDVDWLELEGKDVLVTRFEEHFSASAKRRAADQKRKARGNISASASEKTGKKRGAKPDTKRGPEPEPPTEPQCGAENSPPGARSAAREKPPDNGIHPQAGWSVGGAGAPPDAPSAYAACGLSERVARDLADRAPSVTVDDIGEHWRDICANAERIVNPQGVLVHRICAQAGIERPKFPGKLSAADVDWMRGVQSARTGRRGAGK